MGYDNLHCHTTNSDGELTVPQILEFCEKNGISSVAFTDHDAVLRDEDIKYLKEYKGPVRWVSGIEISVGHIPELDKQVSTLHMVGLFVDPTNKELIEFCTKAQSAREDRMRTIITNLKTIGINITQEDCLEASGGEVVARPHIVQAIMKYPENVNKMMSLYEELKNDKSNRAKELMGEIELRGDRQIPYQLFLTDGAYIPNIYVESEFKPTWDECVNVIRNAGGLSFLPHYYTYYNRLPLELVTQFLNENRLDGVEVVSDLNSYANWDSDIAKEVEYCRNLMIDVAKKTNCLVSGGGDCHKRVDWEHLVKNKRFADRTVGLLDDILKRCDRELGWYKS